MPEKCRIDRYYLQEACSPTQYNLAAVLNGLGWRPARLRHQASFGLDNLAFDEAVAQCLEYKHELAQLVARYCPDIMPATFGINDHNWRQVLQGIAARYPDPSARPYWILKPSMLNNGQHIRLFASLDELGAHYASSHRLGGEHVLQAYVAQPHLLRDARKYSIRLFMILTSQGGAFLYPKGYFNVSRQPFSMDNHCDLAVHLTNEHLHGDEPNVIQIPSERFDFFAPLYQEIKAMLTRLIKALRAQYPDGFASAGMNRLALFGMDFMVDAGGRVWLLEANHGPCFPVRDDHPLQGPLYQDFWQALVRSFVLPMADASPGPAPDVCSFFDPLY